MSNSVSTKSWKENVIKQDEIDKYLVNGKDFINEREIFDHLEKNQEPSKQRVRDIIQKSLNIERLDPAETAALINVKDESVWQEMYEAAYEVKKRVYDNRVVFFAPLYCSNLCVNNCAYCGFASSNTTEKRRILSHDEIKRETASVIDEGHKRMILVYGEHPSSDIDYIVDSINSVYSVERTTPTGKGTGSIRRVNINAAPMEIAKLRQMWEAGIGTFQVFQETYHRPTYEKVHPSDTIKGDYRWRLYSLHRAMEAGIDDLGIGALFGLYDWKFDVMGLLYHTMDLERQFEIGPHTISFPRLTPAAGSPITTDSNYLVSDDEFKKLVTVLRLAVPYTGLIITARESPEIRRQMYNVGITQTDASTKIGIGKYSENYTQQEKHEQQFMLGDTRSLDEVVKELAEMGLITSFCTAGYRCGRTGDKIMGLLKNCVEGRFCKLNAVLTYKEFLDDYASPETKALGEQIVKKEIEEIKNTKFFKDKNLLDKFEEYYQKTSNGQRDLYL